MKKTVSLHLCLLSFGSAIFLAFGMYNIHAVSGITEGGILGAVLLVQHLMNFSPAVSSLVLNGLCYLMGWRALGKTFLVYSAVSAAGYAVGYGIFEQFPPLFPEIAAHPLLSALAGSLFVGIGCGVCVRIGGAPCGDDALAMSISHMTGIPIQWVYLFSDMTVLLLSLSYIPLSKISYSLLTVILSGQIIGLLQKKQRNAR